MRYFKWEGSRLGCFCEGVIKISADPSFKDPDLTAHISARLRARDIIYTGGYEISATMRKKVTIRIVCGAVGLAGCSAAAILLPVPVAIWAASAFAALTVSAIVPP